ncbi:Calpain-C [Portunus trituberculatus]|uniref:Calpain-C n=1 Tax=Portunus trituberculatus TaxID=210409 RepID=A0A5B7E4T7_PORTR|nr:Calpain-C [Portunus trituberculatus]
MEEVVISLNQHSVMEPKVCERVQLEQGGYILLPTTFEPGQESAFTLRVFSSKPLKLKLVDTPSALVQPAVVKARDSVDAKSLQQYEAVFLQVADEHRIVNAFELHELLEACLPNGKLHKELCQSGHLQTSDPRTRCILSFFFWIF